MQNDTTLSRHIISMQDCATLSVSGVKEIISFDELNVSLVTSCGVLNIDGEGLHIASLDLVKGMTEINGQISGMYYTKAREKGPGFFRRGR